MNRFNFKTTLENLTLSTLTKEDFNLLTPVLDDTLPKHARRNNLRGAAISVQASLAGRKRNFNNKFHTTETDFRGAASHT